MLIHDILERWNAQLVVGDREDAKKTVVFGAVVDNRHVTMGDAFCAVRPTALDYCNETRQARVKADRRLKFAGEAITSGAQLIIANHDFAYQDLALDSYTERKIFVALVDDASCVFAELDAALTQPPKLNVASVTGTNGKTSTVGITRDMLLYCGVRAFSIGTLGIIGEKPLTRLYETLTTPIASAMHRIFKTLHNHHKAQAIVMEASSQGLVEGRVSGIKSKVAAFTNFTQDHLDYHQLDQVTFTIDPEGAMDRYFDAKMKLFLDRLEIGGTAILNKDMDRFEIARGRIAEQRHDVKILTYSATQDADVTTEFVMRDGHWQKIMVRAGGNTNGSGKDQKAEAILPLLGDFQVSNAACAITIGLAMGYKFDVCVAALAHVSQIPGRMQLIGQTPEGGQVFVDYAHSDDAIKQVIQTVRNDALAHQISIVFGGGGERDRSKYVLMAKEAAKADRVYITDDNPRRSDPQEIRSILEQQAQRSNSQVQTIPDRALAIQTAIKDLPPNGILVICGKGHEDYQEYAATDERKHNTRSYFSDEEVAQKALTTLSPMDQVYSGDTQVAV